MIFRCRRNFLNLHQTRLWLIQHIFLVQSVRWGIIQNFINTELFSGPDQFAIQNSVYFLIDVYYTLYNPAVWILTSKTAMWAGWGRKDKSVRKYFYYVRKPDPLEEFRRKGYRLNDGDSPSREMAESPPLLVQEKSPETNSQTETIELFSNICPIESVDVKATHSEEASSSRTTIIHVKPVDARKKYQMKNRFSGANEIVLEDLEESPSPDDYHAIEVEVDVHN